MLNDVGLPKAQGRCDFQANLPEVETSECRSRDDGLGHEPDEPDEPDEPARSHGQQDKP